MTLKQTFLLYRLISRNKNLQERRHPMFEKNMAMKVFMYIFVGFWAVYLMMFGFAFYGIFDGGTYEAFDMIDGGMIFFLAIDFLLRFAMQETPAQDVKPYKMFPIPSNFLLNTFLFRMGLGAYNLFWGFFFVPFALFAVVKYYGFLGMVSYLFGWWLMYILNSYWYLLCRTFINKHVALFLPPFVLYGLLIYFGIFFDESNQWLFHFSVWLGRLFVTLNPLYILLFLILAVPLFFINRRFQYTGIYLEIAKADVVKSVKTNQMKALDRLGQVGEYLKLEIKSTRRNATIRKTFISGLICQSDFCAIFAFTPIYDDMPFMRIYICVYCFTCMAVMTLTTIMCAEGNYIDGLMAHRESILSLMRAKYYFNCALLVLPLLFSLMPIIEGKMTALEAFGCLFFTSGVIMPFLFQLAVYNDSTINLNAKMTKSGRSTKAQMIISSVALFVPMGLMYLFMTLWGEDIAALLMLLLGLIGTVLHPFWLRNTYTRFMVRRHKNMEGFRASRG